MKVRWVILLFIVALFLWGLWADYSVAISQLFLESKSVAVQEAGSWGDTFGAFTALISTLGTVIVIVTLNVQRRAIRDQALDLHRQRFESHFFELLKLARELKAELSYEYSDAFFRQRRAQNFSTGIVAPPSSAKLEKIVKGGDAFQAAIDDYRFHITQSEKYFRSFKSLGESYLKHIHPRAEPTFSPYFRLIYTILDRLRSDNVLTASEKHQYARLLRSQLTSTELTMIAVNATATSLSKDMHKLLVDFRMLKYLPQTSLYKRLRHAYGEEAFQPRD